ncbi:hypothetical protein [Phenylobacterium sp.]|uniref:hypothetical protein n=1 Tax=Phenylobacterium sp. TaxID=1871053 RepID=UPI0025D5E3FE|nr:hypothetical protein [Phenylobacterium sp.]
MSEETTGELYLILATAAAGPTTRYPTGERRRVLLFVRAGSHDAALARATAGLSEHGWGEPEFIKAGIFELGPHLSADDRAPAEHALVHGFALRVYA